MDFSFLDDDDKYAVEKMRDSIAQEIKMLEVAYAEAVRETEKDGEDPSNLFSHFVLVNLATLNVMVAGIMGMPCTHYGTPVSSPEGEDDDTEGGPSSVPNGGYEH